MQSVYQETSLYYTSFASIAVLFDDTNHICMRSGQIGSRIVIIIILEVTDTIT